MAPKKERKKDTVVNEAKDVMAWSNPNWFLKNAYVVCVWVSMSVTVCGCAGVWVCVFAWTRSGRRAMTGSRVWRGGDTPVHCVAPEPRRLERRKTGRTRKT